MKTFDYHPEIMNEEKENVFHDMFEGFITIQVPNEHERMEHAKKFRMKFEGKKEQSEEDKFEQAEWLKDLAKKAIKGVDLTHKESGIVFSEYEDLLYSKEGSQITNSIGTVMIQGIQLGNVKKKA